MNLFNRNVRVLIVTVAALAGLGVASAAPASAERLPVGQTALLGAAPSTGETAPTPVCIDPAYPGYYIQYGSTGFYVRAVQCKMRTTQDGIFGHITEARVREFQYHAGLVTDGIVGPLTWRAMFD
jgi:peptidoglycan hydrolase-like protein with peptidoglycan-binding domain